jgi:hypothetical protein
MANLRGNQDWSAMAKNFDSMSGRGNKIVDDRFYEPSKDSEGKVAVTLRFLPSPDSPAVMEEAGHWFQGPDGETYKENCPRAHKLKCPACDMAGKAWGNGDKDAYKKWGNSSKYVGNILIINDLANPENNGKVFLYRFGKGIYNEIDGKMNPKSQLEQPSIVFDYNNGENFNLIGEKDSFRNQKGDMIEFTGYKNSKFIGPEKSVLTEEQIVAADAGLHSLKEWLPENRYKTKEELETRLGVVMNNKVLGTPVTNPVTQAANAEADSDAAALDALAGGATPQAAVVESTGDDDTDAIMARLNAISDED